MRSFCKEQYVVLMPIRICNERSKSVKPANPLGIFITQVWLELENLLIREPLGDLWYAKTSSALYWNKTSAVGSVDWRRLELNQRSEREF